MEPGTATSQWRRMPWTALGASTVPEVGPPTVTPSALPEPPVVDATDPFDPVSIPVINSVTLGRDPVDAPTTTPETRTDVAIGMVVQPMLVPEEPTISTFSRITQVTLPAFIQFDVVIEEAVDAATIPGLVV